MHLSKLVEPCFCLCGTFKCDMMDKIQKIQEGSRKAAEIGGLAYENLDARYKTLFR